MSPAPATGPGPPRAPGALSWGAWGAILSVAFVRAMIAFEPFPYWGMDPTVLPVPMTGLGPAGSLLLDAVLLLASGAALAAAALRRERVSAAMGVLALAGSAAAAAHALGLLGPAGPDLDHLRAGATWSASIAAGVAAWHLVRDERMARAAAALLVGFVAMLAVKGAVQVFVEHPATVANFQANRAAILASHGWAEGSPMALGFERRLRQPEATGWFGLANVFASFAAASCVALTALAVAGFRESRAQAQRVDDGVAGIAAVGALVALACVVLAGSKAGYAVTAMGLAAVGMARAAAGRWPAAGALAPARRLVGRRPALAGGVIAAGLVLTPAAAVALHGALGEGAGDPSLLFRWFYAVGAARVIADHPLLGVGPAGFQDAYQLLKPALSPEVVESPHNIALDFAAALGLPGLAWIALALGWGWSAGVRLCDPAPAPDAPRPQDGVLRPLLWVVLPSVLAAAWLPALVAGAMEGRGPAGLFRVPAATPDWALVWLIGGVAWMAAAFAVARIAGAAGLWRPLVAPVGLVLLAHAQIEMTAVRPGSAALFIVALAVSGSSSRVAAGPRLGLGLGAAFVALGAGLLAGCLPRVWAWEASLAHAAAAVAPVAELRARWERLEQDPVAAGAEGDSFPRLESDLRSLTARYPWFQPADFPTDYQRLFRQILAEIDHPLREQAAAAFPNHFPTRRAASRVLLQRAATPERDGSAADAGALAARAEDVARAAAEAQPRKAAAWSWLASVRLTRARLGGDEANGLAGAAEALERAAALDPHGLSTAVQLALLYERLGRGSDASRWARKALDIDQSLRLDPLLRLSESDRARLAALAG